MSPSVTQVTVNNIKEADPYWLRQYHEGMVEYANRVNPGLGGRSHVEVAPLRKDFLTQGPEELGGFVSYVNFLIQAVTGREHLQCGLQMVNYGLRPPDASGRMQDPPASVIDFRLNIPLGGLREGEITLVTEMLEQHGIRVSAHERGTLYVNVLSPVESREERGEERGNLMTLREGVNQYVRKACELNGREDLCPSIPPVREGRRQRVVSYFPEASNVISAMAHEMQKHMPNWYTIDKSAKATCDYADRNQDRVMLPEANKIRSGNYSAYLGTEPLIQRLGLSEWLGTGAHRNRGEPFLQRLSGLMEATMQVRHVADSFSVFNSSLLSAPLREAGERMLDPEPHKGGVYKEGGRYQQVASTGNDYAQIQQNIEQQRINEIAERQNREWAGQQHLHARRQAEFDAQCTRNQKNQGIVASAISSISKLFMGVRQAFTGENDRASAQVKASSQGLA